MGGRDVYIVRSTGELTQMSWPTNQSSGTLANTNSVIGPLLEVRTKIYRYPFLGRIIVEASWEDLKLISGGL